MVAIWAVEVLILLFTLFFCNSVGGGDAGGKNSAFDARAKNSFEI